MTKHKLLSLLAILCLSQGCVSMMEREFDQHSKQLICKTYAIPDTLRDIRKPGIKVTYFGTSTLLFDDGKEALLIDGFFSRPGLRDLIFSDIQQVSDTQIEQILRSAGVSDLKAVVAVHSHHDHAMDSSCIARSQSAALIGSQTTHQICCGMKCNVTPINRLPGQGKTTFSEPFDQFKVTLIKSKHGHLPWPVNNLLGLHDNRVGNTSVLMPAHFTKLKEGGSYSVLIEHHQGFGNILVHATAGHDDDVLSQTLKGTPIDWLFLGVGRLDDEDAGAYLDEMINRLTPRHVVPIHWDDFTRNANKGTLYPPKRLFGDFEKEIGLLATRISKVNQQHNKDIKMYLMNYLDKLLVNKVTQKNTEFEHDSVDAVSHAHTQQCMKRLSP